MGKTCGDSELCLHPAGTCPRWPPAGVPDEGEARMREIIGRAEGRFYRPSGAVGGGSPMRRSLQRFLQKRRERILGAGEPYVRRKPEAPQGEAEAVCTSLCL